MLDLVLDLLFLAPNSSPLYIHRLMPGGSQSADRLIHIVSGSVTNYTCLAKQVIHIWQFILLGLKSPLGLGASTGLYESPSLLISRQWYTRPLLSGSYPVVISPTGGVQAEG